MVSFVYMVIFVYICEYMSSAQSDAKHDKVERKMCNDLPNICPCDATYLQVEDDEGPLIDCAKTYPVARFATLPRIKPAAFHDFTQVFLTHC